MSSSSSDEESEDSNIFDQLKSIKAFTIDQLYLLHPDVGCPPSSSTYSSSFAKNNTTNPTTTNFNTDSYHDQELYQNLIDYEQLRNKLYKLKTQVKLLNRKTFDHVDKVWYFEEKCPKKIGMCKQGKVAEATFKYKKALINSKQLNVFDLSFNELVELISKDYIYYSFESQMRRFKIGTQLSTSYKILDEELRKNKLKFAITTLINFIKHLGDSKSDFVIQCRRWLRGLMKRFLEGDQVDDYKFIISQLCKGPAGTADWSSDLIEYKPHGELEEFSSTPQYITHCCALLSELFNNMKTRISNRRRVTISINNNSSNDDNSQQHVTSNQQTATTTTANESSLSSSPVVLKADGTEDQNWSLIDPRFVNCDEELPSNMCNTLTESDVIKYCLRIPVAQIFRDYVKKCLESNKETSEIVGHPGNDKNYEYIMLKLLTIGTVIIKTYQIGLETFNSIQYGNLIEYLSSQLRRTVIVLSDQWTEFKRRLKGLDNALLMRLQVEYDNFILRSILIILELRQSGIWRHLSRIEPDDLVSIENTSSWTADGIRPAFVKLLQVTGLTPISSASPNSTPITQSTAQTVVKIEKPINTTSLAYGGTKFSNSLTYEFSIEWFKEVSESMLWHIMWQFYHNAFVSSCDYHSDNYWIEKFQEKSVVYLFVNKIRDSPKGECSYLINSVTSMLLSRTRHDSKFISFVATQLFNLSFKHPDLRDKITKKGILSLIKCGEKFPNLISLYISFLVEDDNIDDEDIVKLFRGSSLRGWLCDDEEFCVIASWLVESSLASLHNKVARIIISKLLLNSSQFKPKFQLPVTKDPDTSVIGGLQGEKRKLSKKNLSKFHHDQRFVDLRFRRRLALLLYEASIRHLPETNDYGPQSFGSKVELAFSTLFCENNPTSQVNLLELSVATSYQQFYIWIWRLLFTFKLHILNQPETDWNDVQSRSGTSRSIRNTVLLDDSFHPVPTIQDSECLSLSEGVKNKQPIASYIYLSMTDVTWQSNTLSDCLAHLNSMVASGHLTPSLMAFKFLIICHLNDLSQTVAKDQNCIDYLATIINSDFDTVRLASLIIIQMQNLKQYRQLQLSQFYITILLEVAHIILKQQSASWFSSNEYKLEKIACLLDYIIKFNFPTQRPEIIRKFYDCSYSAQSCKVTSSWVASFFTTTNVQNISSSKREFITTLHVLTQKFKKFSWLRWVTTECDTLRLEKIWEDMVQYLSTNEDATIDMAMKKVCPQVNSNILKSTIPIYSWLNQILDLIETDLNHPLCPLIWYNFFLNYFSNTLNGGAIGSKLISGETLKKLSSRLDSLFNYHLYKQRNWSSVNPINNSNFRQSSLAGLYRAYRLWLQDASLQDVYVDMDRLKQDYLVPLLKTVMESTSEVACLQYIDLQAIEIQNRNLSQVWLAATTLEGNSLIKDMMFVAGEDHNDSLEMLTSIDDEASDAVSLIVKPSFNQNNQLPETNRSLNIAEEEFKSMPNNIQQQQQAGFGQLCEVDANNSKESNLTDTIELVKKNCSVVFEEASMFGSALRELDKLKIEIVELIQHLFVNKKAEHIRFVCCNDGNECAGPARIKFEVEEATIDDRKSECIQDRQRQCDEMIEELLIMPTTKVVKSTILIEDTLDDLIKQIGQAKIVIEEIMRWIAEPNIYSQLNGSYYTANHLLKSILEILSNTNQVDAYNRTLMNASFDHPGSVQIFSPYLSPSACSSDCFLNLYKKVCQKQNHLGPMALFVLLSKFDLNSWLAKNNNDENMHHDIIKTTCSALGNMGKQPDESFNLTFDLYKRHLQIELAPPDRRRPKEIFLVLSRFLEMMDDQVLCPSLWIDFLSIIGLEKQISATAGANMISDNRSIISMSIRQQLNNSSIRNSPGKNSIPNEQQQPFSAFLHIQMEDYEQDQFNLINVIEDVAKLADSQTLLDYYSLNDMILKLGQFIEDKNSAIDVTLVELYYDYLEQFSIVMISITLMWLKFIGEQYPDNHELIWKRFLSIWYHWIFLSKNCQNVGKSGYSLMSNQFVASIRYMIYKIPDNTQMILKSILSTLNNYVRTTSEIVYLELSILQRCLKHLPWSSLEASKEDFDNIASLSDQENYNVSELITHILMQIDIKDSLKKIAELNQSDLPHVTERLATSIIYQSNHLRGFRISGGGFFAFVPINDIENLSKLIMMRMEFANLEHSQNNKLLINLLRFMCIRLEPINESPLSRPINQSTNNNQHQTSDESFERSVIYANFVSEYLIGLIKNHQSQIFKYHKPYLFAVMDNSLQDLKILVSPDVGIFRKASIYESLLNCCSSSQIDEKARIIIARSLVRSSLLKNNPIVVMEVFHSIGQIISDPKVLVYAIEKMIVLYLNNNGHYEKVWKSFQLKVLPGDMYLEACVSESAPLAMLIYFESLIHNGGHEHTNNHQATSITDSSQSTNIMSNNKILASFFHWLSRVQLKSYVNASNEIKSNDLRLSIAWLKLIDMFEANLMQYLDYERPSASMTTSRASQVEATTTGNDEPTDINKTDLQSRLQADVVSNSNTLFPAHKALIDFIKHLVSIYDSSNSSGLWSYLKFSRSEESSSWASILALSIACFLSDRILINLRIILSNETNDSETMVTNEELMNSRMPSNQRQKLPQLIHLSLLRDEILKLRRSSLSKLEAARKVKNYQDKSQFIESIIESVNQNDKVQYSDGVQLVTTFVKNLHSEIYSDDCINCIGKILP